ncbi:MAG: right-handed parallel beta-helix repeat-containing protein [Hyphomicrobium sp.]|nr:right-handed parallel beta-helix repeat-containing protein [Hyphomicrobium sp.]
MATVLAGSTYQADGITDRPQYAYEAPKAFFETDPTFDGPVFDIREFGAVEGAGVNNQPMIQAAIEAAHAAGGGIVYIPAGTWGVGISADGYGSVHLMDNVFLKGAGMGITSLRLMDGISRDVTGIVRTTWNEGISNSGLADLTLDGNMANTTGKVDGFFTGPQPGETTRDSDIYVTRVEIHSVSRYGFDPHEQTERLSITNSVAHHNGFDGFVLDYNVDALLEGNVSYGNGRHGFNFVTTAHDVLVQNNTAYGNGGAGFVIQRGSENIDSSHSITLVGGASYDNGREGVLVQMSRDVVITGMTITDNGREGVRISGSSNVTVEGNTISGNSQSKHDGFAEVAILAYDDTAYGRFYEANHNLIANNVITATGDVMARYGIEERSGGTLGNVLGGNEISGSVRGPFSINGTDSYVLNLGTGADDMLVGSATKDLIVGGDGADQISGQDGDDLVEAGLGHDNALGGKGNDKLFGDAGDDVLNGNSGNDFVAGDAGNDRLIGHAGDDRLEGGVGNDSIDGGSGNDSIAADLGNDTVNGGSGFDTLDFSLADASVSVDLVAKTARGAGTDSVSSIEAVTGSRYADSLMGDKNANIFDGGAGDDVIRGFGASDTLVGGEGADRFVWGAAKDVIDSGVYLGMDRITDFRNGLDVLDVKALIGKQSWTQISDVVATRDTAEGTIVSVKIAGQFQDVVQLDGLHGVDPAMLGGQGMILV